MQTAAERTALTRQTYRVGERMLDTALADPSWSAAVEQKQDPSGLPAAVILDVDETVLDNSSFEAQRILEDGLFETEAWNDWCRLEDALPIPGAVEFTRYAAEKGVAVLYVTNRRHEVEEATRRNLEKHGFPLDAEEDTLYTRAEREEWDDDDKSGRRADIVSRYRVLLLFGDDLNDFVSGSRASLEERNALVEEYDGYWGSRWFMLPNSTYGGWEGALTEFDYTLAPAPRLLRKYGHLRLPVGPVQEAGRSH
jgi:acid phosphatase